MVSPAHSSTDAAYSHNTGPKADTTYSYRVRGVNGYGVGGWSGLASATTQESLNFPVTVVPAISRTAEVSEILTADTSGIVDEDGLDNAVYSY